MKKYTVNLVSYDPYVFIELKCFAYDIDDATTIGEQLAEKLGLSLSGVHRG